VSVVVSVPETLDHRSFDALVAEMARADGARVLFDARHVRWTNPFGMVGLLAAGAVARQRAGEAPQLEGPENAEVVSYLTRMNFFAQAAEVFRLERPPRRSAAGASDALLEVTAIRSHQDVHDVVDRVRGRATAILSNRLHYPPSAALQFSVILSEVCQNVVEHANAEGWVAAQTYNWKQRLGRLVAVVAVADVGVGFRGSLAAEHARRYGERWSDATALQAALFEGVSRYTEPGRGQGLQGIRRHVTRWNGEVIIRSGTARIAVVPDWDDLSVLESGLPEFPGAQIFIALPERRPEDAGPGRAAEPRGRERGARAPEPAGPGAVGERGGEGAAVP
jgi:anti-sigma regulatory factor (Ser/Thr protein kinase)